MAENELDERDGACNSYSLTSSYDDNLGSYGNMFDVRTYDEEITLFGVDFYTDITDKVTYKIYTKSNSFHDDGGKEGLSAWTLLKTGSTFGAGWKKGTPVRDFPMGNLTMAPNEKRSFYVTLTTTDLRYRDIRGERPDAVVGDTYVQNEDLEIQVGVSLGNYPLTGKNTFFGKRGWSGSLHYYLAGHTCAPSTSPSMLDSQSPSSSPSQNPSASPSMLDSQSPSSSQSQNPSGPLDTPSPTVTLSTAPSTPPSLAASVEPTIEPSLASPTEPTITLSTAPSPAPSIAASGEPTIEPSLAASIDPTASTPVPSPTPSSAPSLSLDPSSAPSTVPMALPSLSMSPSRDQPDEWECSDNNAVETTFDGGTGAYGNMFTVTAKEEAVRITTLSFHTDNSKGNVTAMVYTKMGDFVGYENEPRAWKKISESTLWGAGGGYPSMIPIMDFESVHLLPNETAAFYITLTTADIRYSNTKNTTLGSPIASDDYLDVSAGVGLADYPFASEYFLYAPREFNGVVHFSKEADCLPLLKMTYSFNIHHPADIVGSELYRLVANNVETSARSLLDTQPILLDWAKNHHVSVDSASGESGDGKCAKVLLVSSLFVCVLNVYSFQVRVRLPARYMFVHRLMPL